MKTKRSDLSTATATTETATATTTTTTVTRACVSPTASSVEKLKKTSIIVNANTNSPFCCPTDCAYNMTEGGNITSPLFPNNYPDGVRCVWILEAPVNHTVKLDLEEFHLEKDKKCFYDYMEFFDGDTEEHYLLRERMCGRHDPQPLESTGQKLMVVFKSDKSENYKGFRAVWETKRMSKKIE